MGAFALANGHFEQRAPVAINLAFQPDEESGDLLWRQTCRVAPLTLAADQDRVYFHDGERVAGLNRATGQPLWASEPVERKSPFPTGYGPALAVQQGVVLVSVENRSMTAFSAADGKTLWRAPHHRGGHASPDDMLVINGLVWSGAVANGTDSGVFTGRDICLGGEGTALEKAAAELAPLDIRVKPAPPVSESQ